MARKDRRFKGADVARLYCKNLDEGQREIAAYLMDNCGAQNFTEEVLRALADYYKPDTTRSLFFEAIADIVKGGDDLIGEILKLLPDFGNAEKSIELPLIDNVESPIID